MIYHSWCALFFLWFFVPMISANDFGLINPAAEDFAEARNEPKHTGGIARRTPAFTDRTLPTPPRQDAPIRQVSTFENDPFPVVSQPMPPQAGQGYPFDWGTAPLMALHAQHAPNAAFPGYAPNYGHADQYAFAMQEMQNWYLAQQFAQQQLAQQQFAQQQLAQQQYHQGYMMPQTDPYQYGYFDPHGTWGHPMGQGQQPIHQPIPDHSAMYQAFLLQQELIRRQEEEAQARGNGEQTTSDTTPQAMPQWSLENLMPVRITSPLGETMLAGAKVMSPFSTPPGPHKGVGMPLVNKSWRDHPYYFGGFVGYVSGSKVLVSQMIEQKNGGTGGLTFGYNFNDYWGLESRLHFTSIDIHDTSNARQIFETNYLEQFPGMAVPPLSTRTNTLSVLDVAVQYYPLGNAKWRPYFKYGLGVGRQRFTNTFGHENKANVVTMPLGIGVRYWWNERIAIQADLLNNMVFASSIAKTQHNISFSMGLTYAFGSGRATHPIHFWPSTPSMGSKW